MPDMDDLVAREQAKVLGGGVHRFPRDNYSVFEMWGEPALFCARVLAGEGSDFIFGEWARELDPGHPVGVLSSGKISGI
jgi:hypothetical protein